MKDKVVTVVCVFVVLFFVAHQCDKEIRQNRVSNSETRQEPVEQISCMVCGKDLTNDYNRIAPNGNGYYCTPCYKQTMRDIHEEIRSEGYD